MGQIKNMMIESVSTKDQVLALSVNIVSPSDKIYQTIDYTAGQIWYAQVTVINTATTAKNFKIELNLAGGDGAWYWTSRLATSLPANYWARNKIDITSYVAKLGLITLTFRVYGTGMGNTNKVCSQVLVY
jgi:hypothetical protein